MTPVIRHATVTAVAPPTEAARPGTVIPPEVPAGTRRRVSASRGELELCLPTSVAQVSAAAVASADAKRIDHALPGRIKWHAAHRPGMEPFATTCLAVRRVVPSAVGSKLASRVRRDKTDEVTKNVSNGTDQVIPPAAKTIVPSALEARAARTVSAPAAAAPVETKTARQRPIATFDDMRPIVSGEDSACVSSEVPVCTLSFSSTGSERLGGLRRSN